MNTYQETAEDLCLAPAKGSVAQTFDWELKGRSGKGFVIQFEDSAAPSLEVRVDGDQAVLEIWENIPQGQRLSNTATLEAKRLGTLPELSYEGSSLLWDFVTEQGEFAGN